MKRSSPLWGSVSVLIGVVIAILALVRGAWLVPLLLLTFTAWGLWVVMFQLQPAWDSIRGYRFSSHTPSITVSLASNCTIHPPYPSAFWRTGRYTGDFCTDLA